MTTNNPKQNPNIKTRETPTSTRSTVGSFRTCMYTNEQNDYQSADIDFHQLSREQVKSAKITSQTQQFKDEGTGAFVCRTFELSFCVNGVHRIANIRLFGRD